MKKGVQIKEIFIEKGIITAYDSTGNLLKLTRGERKVLSDYKNENYITNIQKTFGRKDVLDDDFTITRNGSKKKFS